eukprot:3566483-Rhodomonas_salina.1
MTVNIFVVLQYQHQHRSLSRQPDRDRAQGPLIFLWKVVVALSPVALFILTRSFPDLPAPCSAMSGTDITDCVVSPDF